MTNAFLTFYTFRIVNLVVCAAFFIRDTDRTIFAYTLTCPASETHLVFCDLAIYFAFGICKIFCTHPGNIINNDLYRCTACFSMYPQNAVVIAVNDIYFMQTLSPHRKIKMSERFHQFIQFGRVNS